MGSISGSAISRSLHTSSDACNVLGICFLGVVQAEVGQVGTMFVTVSCAGSSRSLDSIDRD